MFFHSTFSFFKYIFFAGTFLLVFIFISDCYAETRYVSDVLVVSLREDKTLKGSIVGYLRSSDQVEIIEEDDTLAKVATENGLMGWIKKKFLVSEPPNSIVVKQLKKENSDLKKRVDSLSSELEKLNHLSKTQSLPHAEYLAEIKQKAARGKELMNQAETDLEKLLQQIAALRAKNQKIMEQLQTVPTLKSELPQKTTENSSLNSKIKEIKSKKLPWLRKENFVWFMAGGIIMLFGFIVGFFSRRKKVYYY